MKPKVLLLEEDPTFASELQTGLRGLGCEVVLVRDGRTGLARAVSDRFDVILLSAELPRMNGFRLCNRIKKDANAKKVPLFLMGTTASAEFEAHQRLPTRAESYFQKPVVFAELVARMRLHLVLEPAPPSAIEAKLPSGEKLGARLEAAREGVVALDALRRKLTDQEAETLRLERELAEARALIAKAAAHEEEIARLRRTLDEARAAPPKGPPPLPPKELAVLREKLAAETSARVDLNEKLVAGAEALRTIEEERNARGESLARAEKRILLLERACAEQVPALKKARADAAANEGALIDARAMWDEERQRLIAEAAFARTDAESALAKAKLDREKSATETTRLREEIKKASAELAEAIKARDGATASLASARQVRSEAEVERESVLVDLVSTRRSQRAAEEEAKELKATLSGIREQHDAEVTRLSTKLTETRRERDVVEAELEGRIAVAVADAGAKGREELSDLVERAGEAQAIALRALKEEHAAALDILSAEREGALQGERRRGAEAHADAREELARMAKELTTEIAAATERTKSEVERGRRLAADARRAAEAERAARVEAEARFERLTTEREAERRSAVPVLEAIDRFSEEAALKIAMLETERTETLASRESAHAKEIVELQAARDRAVGDLRAAHDTARRSAADARRASHDLEVKLAQTHEAHAAAVARLEQDVAEARAYGTREQAAELARANADAARLAATVEELLRATNAQSLELADVRKQSKAEVEKLGTQKRTLEERIAKVEASLRAAEADEGTRRSEIATLRKEHERGVEKLMLRLTEADTALVEARALMAAEVERRAELEMAAASSHVAIANAERDRDSALAEKRKAVEQAQRDAETARRSALGLRRALDADFMRTLEERLRDLREEHTGVLEDERSGRAAAITEAQQNAATKVKELAEALGQTTKALEEERTHREDSARQTDALEELVASKTESVERLEKQLHEAHEEVPELEAEIVILRGELMSVRRQLEQEALAARAAQTQLDRDRDLLAEAKKLLEKIAGGRET